MTTFEKTVGAVEKLLQCNLIQTLTQKQEHFV